LFAQAIEDALQLKQKKVELLEIPLSPSQLFEFAKESMKGAVT
jgi:carbon-monoxide dehydrogenase large subunit